MQIELLLSQNSFQSILLFKNLITSTFLSSFSCQTYPICLFIEIEFVKRTHDACDFLMMRILIIPNRFLFCVGERTKCIWKKKSFLFSSVSIFVEAINIQLKRERDRFTYLEQNLKKNKHFEVENVSSSVVVQFSLFICITFSSM